MERRAGIAEAVLPCSEFTKVFGRPGNVVVVELEDNTSAGLLVHGDVELERETREETNVLAKASQDARIRLPCFREFGVSFHSEWRRQGG
jgi:hypothetical protein